MGEHRVQKVVIVGGGSAGWMTAAYLARALEDVALTVIESPRIGTIGVGESTFSTIKLFFDFLELRERDWMPACSASYKLAIKFSDWSDRRGSHFYHPFERYESAGGMNAAEWWLKSLRDEPFDYACFTTPWLCDAMRSPRFLDGTVCDEQVRSYFTEGSPPPNVAMANHVVQYPYAYHLNAAEFAAFLRGYAVRHGVEHLGDDVVEVKQRADGSIDSLVTREHGLVEGDLFIDCTGFRGLLINQILREPFIGFNDVLLNDRAVAIPVPRDNERDGLRPYTTARALDAGWSWTVPLYGRDGTGYVYSSKFIDKDEAERELRELLGPAAVNSRANHIEMRVGRCRRSWVKNCVAIGLSGGFVEPLESTAIFFIQHSIEELVNHFPAARQIDENMVTSFNKVINDCVDGVRDFLTIHFYASTRVDTPFWRATKDVPLPDALAERLDIWKARLPSARNIVPSFHGFEDYSWSCMLLGLGFRPVSHLPALDRLDGSQAKAMFRRIRDRAHTLVQSLPSCYEYLTHLHDSRA